MTDIEDKWLCDVLEIYGAVTQTDILGITALSFSCYEEMFFASSEFSVLADKNDTYIAAACSSAKVLVQLVSESICTNWCEGNLMHLGNE